MPVEAKKPSIKLSSDKKSARQARSYGWSLSLPAAVLTNFSELVIYDTTIEPVESDLANVASKPGAKFTFDEYVTRFDDLWHYLSFDSLEEHGLEEVYEYEFPPRGESPFDKRFLDDFRKLRKKLAQAIANSQPNWEAAEISRRTQRVLNALLFLRVCEDRDIGRYQDLLDSANSRSLLSAFQDADRAFNAGLFTVLQDTNISGSELAEVVEEMYWPRSQYAYGVLDPTILAGVYEQYLAERITLSESRSVSIELKPELAHSGGVVATPEYIVSEIVHQTLGPLLINGVPDALSILDPAIGSGVFLLNAYTQLLEAAESPDHRLDLSQRGKLAKEHLFGIDIDSSAVEVATLSLQLAILSDAEVDVNSARGVLPNLDRNLITGNAVVRENFDKLVPIAAKDILRRSAVSPLNLKSALGEKYPRRGFDVVIGNPPYVRIQELAKYMPDQLAYMQDTRSGYEAPQANNFDMYLIFMERALSLLTANGRLGLIVPNRFSSHLSASGVRRKLGERLEYMIHFGEQQLFPNRTTYTAIVIAGPKSDRPVSVAMVNDLDSWRLNRAATELEISRKDLGAGVWPFATEDQTAVFEQLESNSIARLGDP
ncbi:MAG: Eco57I restriction-modification methylase domain-containing protein, partial [Anaerolineales bacterium]